MWNTYTLAINFLFLVLLMGCQLQSSKPSTSSKNQTKAMKKELSTTPKIDIQGHRGCRGLMPENTLPAFIKALELGVTTLELDVVISKDKQVVVSHEPWLSHEICKNAKGEDISEAQERNYNIYAMTYAEIQACDCGQRQHPRFSTQKKMAVYKPRLEDLIDSVNAYAAQHQIEDIWYNIEIKRQPDYDGKYCPPAEEFVDLVLAMIERKGIETSCNLQSFDWEVLRLCHQKAAEIPLAMLVENELSPQENLDRLGFKPEIYSCYFKLVDKQLLDWVKAQQMQLIPWTVNETADIKAMLALPLDGIISDYPDRVQALLEE